MRPRTASLPVNPISRPVDENLLELFLQQLSWLLGGGRETKRTFTTWLLASPPPPSAPAAVLSQGRRFTARYLVQLEQLVEGLPVDLMGSCPAITALLTEGERCLSRDTSEADRYAALMTSIERISSCFGTACASAGETAIVLGRVDLAAVLTSWAAAWRDLQREITPVDGDPGRTRRPNKPTNS